MCYTWFIKKTSLLLQNNFPKLWSPESNVNFETFSTRLSVYVIDFREDAEPPTCHTHYYLTSFSTFFCGFPVAFCYFVENIAKYCQLFPDFFCFSPPWESCRPLHLSCLPWTSHSFMLAVPIHISRAVSMASFLPPMDIPLLHASCPYSHFKGRFNQLKLPVCNSGMCFGMTGMISTTFCQFVPSCACVK